ncbi:MAG: enoyl-CoA hydratase/isomerase family protein [bacterium]
MKLKYEDDIGIIFIDSPKSNSMDHEFLKEAMSLFDEAENNDSVTAVVFTSTDPSVFSVGMNPFAALEFGYLDMYEFIKNLNFLLYKMFGFSKPTVAAINGHALGGGFILTATADYRIIAKGNFRIGCVEVGLGMPMPFGLIKMFEYVMGNKVAERSILNAQKFSPEQALHIGMVDELVEPGDLLESSLEKARALGKIPARAYRITKGYFRKTALDWMESEKAYHLQEWVECWFSKECQDLIRKIVSQLIEK